MRGRPELEAVGAETLAHAEVTYVGSEHIRARPRRTSSARSSVVHEVPPGVDVDVFTLEDRAAALAALLAERAPTRPTPATPRSALPDEGNADAARGVPRR